MGIGKKQLWTSERTAVPKPVLYYGEVSVPGWEKQKVFGIPAECRMPQGARKSQFHKHRAKFLYSAASLQSNQSYSEEKFCLVPKFSALWKILIATHVA